MKPLIEHLQDDLTEVIDKYREEGMTLGEVIGTLEIVKLNLWHEDDDEED